MRTDELLRQATARPWPAPVGPSPGIASNDDGGDYALVFQLGVFLEAFQKIGPMTYADAEANIRLARVAVNTFEQAREALRLASERLACDIPMHGRGCYRCAAIETVKDALRAMDGES